MKKIILIILIATVAQLQAAAQAYHKLASPVAGFGDTAVFLHIPTFLPDSRVVEWRLVVDSPSLQRCMKSGNKKLPDNVKLSAAGEWLESIKVWAIKQD